jgi:hypothetical protein
MENRFLLGGIMRAILIFIIMLVVFPLAASAHLLMYSSDEIRGAIVDGDTNQPIEGAVVVAHWTVTKMILGLVGDAVGNKRELIRLEAVTDKDGKYVIPAWGPKFVSPLEYMGGRSSTGITIYKISYWNKYLSGIEPEIFARGYDVSKLDNKKLINEGRSFSTQFEEAVGDSVPYDYVAPSHRRSIWNGRTIRLKRIIPGEELRFADIERVVTNSAGEPLRDEKGKPVIIRIPVTEKVTEKDLYDQISNIAKTKNICRDILREEPRFSREFLEKYPIGSIFSECRHILKEDRK